MKTIQTRFGEISYDPDKVLRFRDGLIGFEQLRDFVVMPGKGADDPLVCLQSIEQAHVAFLLIDPTRFFPDYRITADAQILRKLGITAGDDFFVLTTITFHKDETVTLNLLAPVIYAPKTDRAIQIVLDGSEYQARTPLPRKTKPE